MVGVLFPSGRGFVSQWSGFCFAEVGVLFPSGRGFHYKMMFLGGFPSGRGFVSQWSGFCFPVVGVFIIK